LTDREESRLLRLKLAAKVGGLLCVIVAGWMVENMVPQHEDILYVEAGIVLVIYYGCVGGILILAGLLFCFGFKRLPDPTRCPACKYDLRGDLKSGCPECGWNRPKDRP